MIDVMCFDPIHRGISRNSMNFSSMHKFIMSWELSSYLCHKNKYIIYMQLVSKIDLYLFNQLQQVPDS